MTRTECKHAIDKETNINASSKDTVNQYDYSTKVSFLEDIKQYDSPEISEHYHRI